MISIRADTTETKVEKKMQRKKSGRMVMRQEWQLPESMNVDQGGDMKG